MEEEEEAEEIVCSCTEYDGRGRKVLGRDLCKMHPVNGVCPTPGCQMGTHANQRCFMCWARETEAAKSEALKLLQKADHYIVQTFWALEALMRDREPGRCKMAPERAWRHLIQDLRESRDWILERINEQEKWDESAKIDITV